MNKLKKQMFDACRHILSMNNPNEQELIDKFEYEYQSNDAIHLYLKNYISYKK